MKTKILITGVAGFIGSNLAKNFLKNKSIIIYGIDNLSTGYKSNIPKGVKFVRGDLSDKIVLKKFTFSPVCT